MLERKIAKRLERFYKKKEKKALLITGARQVGKTFIIEQFAKKYRHYVRINFIENPAAVSLFKNASSVDEMLLRISVFAGKELVKNETLIFFDEVQECKNIATAIKFLVEEGSYQYIMSGSLLGVDLKDIRSVPVGYMDVEEMFPLDFEEFLRANGVLQRVFDALRDSFEKKTPVDQLVHNKLLEFFRLYLIVGGMPAVVQKYLDTNNIADVVNEQKSIIRLYKKDIAKYDPQNKLHLEDIFDLIPSELNSKNKRFLLKNLNENQRFSRFENSFIWLRDAGVALPVFCVSEPKIPLLLSKTKNLFKLFLADVGLLVSMYMDGIQLKILNNEADINFGSVYENAAAQELKAHGFNLFYFNSKKQGELDFVIEQNGEVVPVEIKSGKDYAKHAALNNVCNNEDYGIRNAFVFHNGNVERRGKVTYLPAYMLMFVKNSSIDEKMIYKIDPDILKG